jgi:hypothetical protein
MAVFVLFPAGLVLALRGVKTIIPHPYDFPAATVVFALYLYSFFYCFIRWGLRQKVRPFLPWRWRKKNRGKSKHT